MVVDPGEAEVGEGEPAQLADGVVRGAAAGGDLSISARSEESSMTCTILPNREPPLRPRVAYLGPEATFTEEALLTQADLRPAELTPLGSITAVLEAVARGEVDLGFVPIENAIEGTVSETIDGLVFDVDLRIQREVVLDIHLHLMASPGTALADVIYRVLVPPRPGPVPEVPGPTASRGRAAGRPTRRRTRPALIGESGRADQAAIAPRLAAELYGLEVLAEDVEDHPENQTRFLLVARLGVPTADRPRQDQHRVLPAGRPPGQPARHPGAVRGAQHQPDQARVAADQAGAR